MKPAGIPTRFSRPGRQAQQGVGLIEVLISFFVLAIGLMGLATLQMRTLQFNQGAYHRTQAMVAAYDILDRMRLNREQARADAYRISYGSEATGSELVKADLQAWLAFLDANLPGGEGEIRCDAEDVCTVSIRWKDRFADEQAQQDWEEVTVASQM